MNGPAVLRSTGWDGPAPEPGDYLTTRAGSWYLVVDVAEGAGVGQYRITVERLGRNLPTLDETDRVFRWSWARRCRARR